MADMNISEADQVVQMLKEQVTALQNEVFRAKATQLAEFEADKPRLKSFLHALSENRAALKKDVARLQAIVNKGTGLNAQGRPGVPLEGGGSRRKLGPDGKAMSEESLHAEAAQLKASLSTIDDRIDQARRELKAMRGRSDEQDIWETNLVMLQDTRRMQKEELALIDLELMGRNRLAQASAERAAAEASGELALARASEKLLQAEARIDRIKQQLFFPACKGYTFALGSGGIYFGGKDIIISEVSGTWSLKAETGIADRRGGKGARLTLQVGMPQAPAPQRPKAHLGTHQVSDSLRLRVTGDHAAAEPRHSLEESPNLEYEENGDTTAHAPQSEARPDEMGNSRGKRMAMKFVNKIASKEKYTQGLQGVRKGLDNAKNWAADKARSGGNDSPKSQSGMPRTGVRATISNKISKAKTTAGKGFHAVGRAGRQLTSTRSDLEDQGFSRQHVSAYAGLGPTGTAQEDLQEAVTDDTDAWSEIDESDVPPARSASEVLETGSSRSGGGAGDTSSLGGGRQGMLVAVRCMEVGLVGEKGSKVPNFAVQELSLEMEFQLSLSWTYNPVTGWRSSGRPIFEVNSLARQLTGNTVPVPKTLLKFILGIVVPRVMSQKVQALLPVELGDYLSQAQQGVHITGDIAIVGPALSALDAQLNFQDPGDATKVKDAKRNASHYAAAQEARNMLGLTPTQAGVMAELFGGRLALLTPPRPCTLGALQAYYSVFSSEKRMWEQLGAVWSTAARMTSKVYKAGEAPDFLKLMDGSVANLARKPVHAKLQVNHMDVAVNVDYAMDALRSYFVRSTKEAHNKGTYLDLDAENPESTRPANYQPLEVQLEAIEAFHTWWSGKLQSFKASFKEAGGTFISTADARSFSSGVENVRYEGPLKLEIPLPFKSLEPDGGLTFELPLPNPERQETFARFVNGLKAAMSTPESLTAPTSASGEGIERQGSLWSTSPADWFADINSEIQDRGLQKTWEDAAAAMGPLPESLGKVIVNGMRVRIKLDEERVAELIKDTEPSAIPGLLQHLGNVASLSFTPYQNAETGQLGYMIRLESSDGANLMAEAVALGYKSGEGVSPGRLLRTAQALARAIMITLRMDKQHIKEVDAKMDEVYDVLIREALDASACLEGVALKDDGCLLIQITGGIADSESPDTCPGQFTNNLDLATLAADIAASDVTRLADERVARQLGFARP